MMFKNERISKEWYSLKLDPLLQEIVTSAASQAFDIGWVIVLTCIWRSPEENDALYGSHGDHLDGVHVQWRGVDVRTEGAEPDAVHAVTDSINATWQYDIERPTKLVAFLESSAPNSGSSAQHLHLQTHKNTTKIA